MATSPVIRAEHLAKRYHPPLTFLRLLMTPLRYGWVGLKSLFTSQLKEPEVRDVTFTVPRGSVVGFLGPNGAGKTTTIKLLTRLLCPDHGSVEILDKPLASEDPRLVGLLGCSVGEPCFYTYLTGEENLTLLSELRGLTNDGSVQNLLERVGLAGRDKKFSDYSTGMRKRLALAHALLGKPEILILDEPSAGLDPRGRVELRRLIHGINRESGVTVFISSHELKELEDICDHLVIIEKGKISVSGLVNELRQKLEETGDVTSARVYTTTGDEMLKFLEQLPYIHEVHSAEAGFTLRLAAEGLKRLPVDFVAAGHEMSGYFETRESIEEIYLRATEEESA